MKRHIKPAVAVMLTAIILMVAFVALAQAQAPYTVQLTIRQSHGVSASGQVSFTKGGRVIGGPFTIRCPGPYGDYNVYVFDLPEEPDDISWDITINWSGACGDPNHNAEQWTGNNRLWPQTYRKTHSHSPEEWEVFFGPSLPPTGVNTYWLGALALLAMAMGLVVMKRAKFLRA